MVTIATLYVGFGVERTRVLAGDEVARSEGEGQISATVTGLGTILGVLYEQWLKGLDSQFAAA